MNRYTNIVISIYLLTLDIASTANADNNERWYLMSRHGECLEIKSLQRKIPEIGDIKNPIEFSNLMKNRGYKVNVTQQEELNGKAIFVTVPEKDLHLIFAIESICKELKLK